MTMYRLDNLRLAAPVRDEEDALHRAVSRKLRCLAGDVQALRILKKSIDARKKPDVWLIYSVVFTLAAPLDDGQLRRMQARGGLRTHTDTAFPLPELVRGGQRSERPVIVGTGPAGLFCGYLLARAGLCPILLERGRRIQERVADVERHWAGGGLDADSNVQFGEGGAGTFSDGKLNSCALGKDPLSDLVLQTFVDYGADPEILYLQKPHIGTDVLRQVVARMRSDMESMGAAFHLGERLERVLVRDGRLWGYQSAVRSGLDGSWQTQEDRQAATLVLCIGHSARETFSMLYQCGVRMESKPFAVGLRVQHLQSAIDAAQYGVGYQDKGLPPADYKLVTKASSGRSVYSFCMCPGGYVVDASSEGGRLAVNGMSNHDRGSANANAAVVTAVDASVYGVGLFDGMHFQQALEEKAYRLGDGRIPVECLGDYLLRSVDAPEEIEMGAADAGGLRQGIEPQIKGAWQYAPLHLLLPEALRSDLREAFADFGQRIAGYDAPEALLAGVESRTSSPIRILRDASGQSNVRGLYPCGEGAGYAGGITSAAVDGLRAAMRVMEAYGVQS